MEFGNEIEENIQEERRGWGGGREQTLEKTTLRRALYLSPFTCYFHADKMKKVDISGIRTHVVT
jgi:hypothetical protein